MIRKLQFLLSIAVLYFAAFGQFLYNSYSLYIFWPMAFLLSGINIKYAFKQSYFRQYALLWVFFIISFLFAVDMQVAFLEIKMMLGVILSIITLFSSGKKKEMIPWLYGSFVFFYAGMIYYVLRSGILMDFDYQKQRLDMDELNANFFGYYTFYLTYAVFMLAEIVKMPLLKKVFRWLFFAMIPLSGVVSLLTASRQIVVIQVPVILVLLMVRYASKNWTRFAFISVATVVLCAVLFGSTLSDIFEQSMLLKRAQMDVEEDARTVLMAKALQVGCSSPFWGVGPGCFKLFTDGIFSHCNYTELFANYGIFTLLIYVYILWYFISKQWHRFKSTGDRMYLTFGIFGVIFAVDNLFYVFYTGLWLMAFFFLVAFHSEAYFRQNRLYYRMKIPKDKLDMIINRVRRLFHRKKKQIAI